MRVGFPPEVWLFSRRIPPHIERQPVPAGAFPATDAPLEARRDDARTALPNGRRPRPPADLENGAGEKTGGARSRRQGGAPIAQQLQLMPESSRAAEELLGLDIATLTPLEAINKLFELQEMAKERK